MDIFDFLHLLGIARDLAAGQDETKNRSADRLNPHPTISSLGTKIFTEKLESAYGRLFKEFLLICPGTNPMGIPVTYLLLYGSRGGDVDLSEGMNPRMTSILSATKANDLTTVTEQIEEAIRWIASTTSLQE